MTTALAIFGFVLGACIGSFLNVCISRWPAEQSVVSPRSRCPRCEKEIAWYDNIPIVSWLLLRAKCRGCGLPISAQYPSVELGVGILWAVIFGILGPSFEGVRLAVFATLMLGVAITDAAYYLIPDGFTVTGLLFVLATALVAGFRGEPSHFAGPWDALIGACAGAGAIAIVGWLGEVALKKEAMGFGDVTLMAVCGAALGPGRALLTIFLGAALGAGVFVLVVYPVVRMRARPVAVAPPGATPEEHDEGAVQEMPQVPFGVFLAPASVVALLWGDQLITWYLTRVTTGS